MESAKIYVPVLAAFGCDGQLYPRRCVGKTDKYT